MANELGINELPEGHQNLVGKWLDYQAARARSERIRHNEWLGDTVAMGAALNILFADTFPDDSTAPNVSQMEVE